MAGNSRLDFVGDWDLDRDADTGIFFSELFFHRGIWAMVKISMLGV